MKTLRAWLLLVLLGIAGESAFAASSPYGIFGGAGTFAQLPGNLPLVFATAPTGASSTLAVAWPYAATSEVVVFSDYESRTVTFSQNSTSVSWTGSLAGTPTINASVNGFSSVPAAGTVGYTSDFGEATSTGTYWTGDGNVDTGPAQFVVASGCGTVGSVKGGATTGSFTAGATSCVPVINLPYSPNGWWCQAWDITTNTDTLKQTADTTNSCTLSGTVVSADVIVFHAWGF